MRRGSEMRGLKEHAKERSPASGTSGGGKLGRSYNDGYPYPTRLQWVGLCAVASGEQAGRLTAAAGGKRTAASLERRGWIAWVKPEGARFPGWKLTSSGIPAKHSGDLRFAVKP